LVEVVRIRNSEVRIQKSEFRMAGEHASNSLLASSSNWLDSETSPYSTTKSSNLVAGVLILTPEFPGPTDAGAGGSWLPE